MDDELNNAAVWSSANNTNKSCLIIVNTATFYSFTNLHVIHFWNGHRERRSSHWHLKNDIGRAVLIYVAVQPRSHECIELGPPTHLIGKILGRCKYLSIKTCMTILNIISRLHCHYDVCYICAIPAPFRWWDMQVYKCIHIGLSFASHYVIQYKNTKLRYYIHSRGSFLGWLLQLPYT